MPREHYREKVKSIIKKARMTPKESKRVERNAKRLRITEAELLRRAASEFCDACEAGEVA